MKTLINLSEAFNIGLHALVIMCGDKDKKHSVKHLAEKMNSSEAHLSKVMQRFAKAGIVSSTSGPNGGFYLTTNPDKLTILDIYEIIDGKLSDSKCMFNLPVCSRTQCIMGKLLNKVNMEVFNYFSKTKLSDIN